MHFTIGILLYNSIVKPYVCIQIPKSSLTGQEIRKDMQNNKYVTSTMEFNSSKESRLEKITKNLYDIIEFLEINGKSSK